MTAVFLERLEAEAGLPLARCFDLVSGTSSGSIVAGGLAIGPGGRPIVDTSELVAFFRTESPHIFSGRSTGVIGTLRWLNGPLYSISYLQSALAMRAGVVKLSQIESNLLVTAYDMRTGDPVIFQSWLAGSGGSGAAKARATGQGLMRFCPTPGDGGLEDFDLVMALSASAAVPTFFAPVRHPRQGGEHYALVDGFVFASNPVLPAYFAARRLFGGAQRFHILSIGTGKATARYDWRDLKSRGALRWLKPIIEAFPDGVSRGFRCASLCSVEVHVRSIERRSRPIRSMATKGFTRRDLAWTTHVMTHRAYSRGAPCCTSVTRFALRAA